MLQKREHGDIEAGACGHGAIRQNALWGRTKRNGAIVFATMLVAAFAVLAGLAAPAQAAEDTAYVPKPLYDAATADPDALFDVIVQGSKGKTSDDVAKVTEKALDDDKAKDAKFKRKFASIDGVSATLSGKQILKLARKSDVYAITEDSATGATYSNSQLWVPATEVLAHSTNSWNASYSFPTIAIVDSGVQPRADFGSRLRAQVSFVSTGPNASGDGFGHGTLVASIAAGSAEGYTGMSPKSDLVSLDVLNDAGAGVMSDVIAACDWILANKQTYNIRVANFSLNAGSGASILYDPLDAAVEKLWLDGVVVVAAAGNYAVNGAESGVLFSPANDPFVITVGADDVNGTSSNWNDFAAPWSAWGFTYDGFRKPELSAPGRRITAAVPSTSTLANLFPWRKVGSDYMWMSGTSFAAPVASGAAAWFLAKNPSWTPDQVKGALMLDLDTPSGYTPGGALGLGVIDADGDVGTTSPPNPNAGLNQFVSNGTFDREAWRKAAESSASWNSASWSSASWSSASWSSASWASSIGAE